MNSVNKHQFSNIVWGILTAILYLTNPVYAAPGDLDNSFGTDGIVTTTVVSGDSESIRAMAIQVDGKIVVAGFTFNTTTHIKRLALARYNSNGTLDANFGSAGVVVDQLSAISDEPKDMIIQPDGKIIVLCSSWNVASSGSSEDISVFRFNTDGSSDTGFGSDGSVATDINMAETGTSNFSADTPSRMALQADGKIIVSAQTRVTGDDIAVLRYNSDGSLDTTFDMDGVLRMNLNPVLTIADYARAIAVQPDGKIVLAGEWWASSGLYTSNKNPFAARLNTNGDLDTTFGIDGVTESLDIKVGDDVTDLLIQPDGKILVAGFARDTVSGVTGADFLLIRYNSDGSLDTSFNTDGYVVTDGNASSRDQGYSVVLQADGKILLGGLGGTGDMLIRYNADGSLDTTFSSDGKTTSSDLSWSFATVIQADGKILNAGFNSSNQFALVRYEGDTLDIHPEAFSFTDETGVDNSSLVTSGMISVAGLSTGVTVPISIEDGEYALNGSTAYQNMIGYVQNGDQINVRHTAAATTGESVSTVLTIGGQHAPDNTSLIIGDLTFDIFTSTTGDASPDPTPDPDTTETEEGGSDSGGSMSGFLLVMIASLLILRRKYRLK